LAEIPVQPIVGVLTDTASVEQYDISVRHSGGGDHAIRLKQSRDTLRVVLVHLTAESSDEITTSNPGR
jgi:hypothetical protein